MVLPDREAEGFHICLWAEGEFTHLSLRVQCEALKGAVTRTLEGKTTYSIHHVSRSSWQCVVGSSEAKTRDEDQQVYHRGKG